MDKSLGDITLNLILKVVEAEKGAKQYTATIKNVNKAHDELISSTKTLSDKAGKLGFALNGIRDAGNILSSTLRGVFNIINSSNQAYQNLLSSGRQLEASSKLTGASLKELKTISEQTKSQFSLSAGQSNLFTIELTKLGQKAGDVSKVQQSINSLMDLGAGQGLDTEQTLYAIKQAILGIDEGTDKLFQKNPSVLYEEYAKKIGTSAGKLTEQQKSQALLNAVLESGGKLQGQYSEYLNTSAGKQAQLNNKLLEAKQRFGEQLQPVLLSFIDSINGLLSSFNSLSPSTQKWLIILGTAGLTVGRLLPLIGTLKDTFGNLGTSITTLGDKAPGSFAKLEKSGITTFGKGGLLAAALAFTLGLVNEVIDKIDEAERERYKLKYETPTPVPKVPVGYKYENGALVRDESPPTMDFDLYKKNLQKEQDKGKVTPKEQEKIIENQAKVNEAINKSVGTNKELKDTYDNIVVAVRTYGDLLEEINASRTLGDIKDSLLRQVEIDESSGRVIGFYGPDKKDKKAGKATERIKESKSLNEAFSQSLSFAQQLTGVLGIGADSFAGKLLGGLQEGLSLANSFASLLSMVFNIGSGGGGGIFSLLGFASGGQVPGSGQGDTVPAMLTPGEFVVRKSIVQKIGSGFFEWINGGGLFNSLAGHYANGGMVNAAGAGGVQVVVLESRVKGSDIVLAQARENNRINRRNI